MNLIHFISKNYFGIGKAWRYFFLKFFGFLPGLKNAMLLGSESENMFSFFFFLQKRTTFLMSSTLTILLKKYTEYLFLNIQAYIVKRHKKHYPVHGQRRHSNHKTVKRFRGSLIF